MTTEIMTVHKALSELKILEDRIRKEIISNTFCVANKHFNKKIGGVPVEECKKNIKANYNRICDLITRQNAIKQAVVSSNAVTKVLINDVQYTVAEAIWMKQSGMEKSLDLLNTLKTQYARVQMEITSGNKDIDKRVEEYLTKMFGAKEGRTNMEDVEDARKLYIENNTIEMIDGIEIMKTMLELEEKINNFMSEVDAALSVSNAITTITITY